jgi:ribose transport system permease protein
MKAKDRFLIIPPALYMMAILMLIYGALVDNYFTVQNMTNIISQAAPLLVIACGQTLIVLLQGTDLSLGSMMSVVSVLWIVLLNLRFTMWAAIIIVLVVCALFGWINGVIVAKGMLPAFIVTLGTQNIFKSIALLLSNSQTVYFSDPIFRTIAKDKFIGLPYSVWIALICFAFTWVLLKKTGFGMKITGLGGNSEALTLAGASISKSTIKAFVFAGIMAGIGGLLLCCRIESGNPNSGNGMEFNAIAAVLLGGTSMREGRGGVGGTIFGVLLIQVLRSGLTQVGVSSIYQNAIIGIVVLAAIIFDAFLKKRQEM